MLLIHLFLFGEKQERVRADVWISISDPDTMLKTPILPPGSR